MMSPIRNIELFVDKMLEMGRRGNKQELGNFHKFIKESTKMVSSRMKDLLDQGLIEHGSFVPREVVFSPRETVEQIAGILRTLTGSSAVVTEEYSTDLPCRVVGDVGRIEQVLLNLVSNARKYVAKQEGLIKVQVASVKDGDNFFLNISVSDNGPGIADADQSKLFKPFSRIVTHKELNPNGNGLGLHICRLICKNLGGDIMCVSQPGQGATFKFFVAVQAIRDYDFDLIASPRHELAAVSPATQPVITKTALKVKSLLNEHEDCAHDSPHKKRSL